MGYCLVGKIVGTFGIKGELKVISETSFPEKRYKKGSKLLMKYQDKYLEVIVRSHRVHKNMDLVSFSSIDNINITDNINDVTKYVGSSLFVDEMDLEELDDGEFYYNDLIGLECFDNSGNKLGIVEDIRELPRGILLEINLGKKTGLVPFVDEFIENIDLDENKIIINVIEGLL